MSSASASGSAGGARRPYASEEPRRFVRALRELREDRGWSQDELAARLGVSVRTISTWECGYALPPARNRIHVVLALRDAPPARVLALAEGLGLGDDPAVASFLQPYREAVAAAATPAGPSPERLLAALDAMVRETADAMDVAPNTVRAAIDRALAIAESMGASFDSLREAVSVRARTPRGSVAPSPSDR